MFNFGIKVNNLLFNGTHWEVSATNKITVGEKLIVCHTIKKMLSRRRRRRRRVKRGERKKRERRKRRERGKLSPDCLSMDTKKGETF